MGKAAVPDRLLPQLGYDPEFKKVLEHDAIKELYDTSFISDWLDSKSPKQPIYHWNMSFLKEFQKINSKPYERYFEMDNELGISKFNYKQQLYLGYLFFSSIKQIEDIIISFRTYYSKRIPNKKGEISNILDGFLVLAKIVYGKSYYKIRFGKLKSLLKKELDNSFVSYFIDKFIFTKSTQSSIMKTNNATLILKDYHNFLCSIGFEQSGIFHTGIFIIWRALIKYFEDLQKDDNFIRTKGALLENYCYEKGY